MEKSSVKIKDTRNKTERERKKKEKEWIVMATTCPNKRDLLLRCF